VRGDALARLLDDPALRAQLAARGPAQAAKFTVERMVEAHEAVYREALAAR
jgi:glycosyltransferase involved in cell wall biosynthesis